MRIASGEAAAVTPYMISPDPGSNEHKRDVIGGICASMASFIAAIDSDSRDVAAYIKQRLGVVLEHVPIDELEEVGQDARQLAKATP